MDSHRRLTLPDFPVDPVRFQRFIDTLDFASETHATAYRIDTGRREHTFLDVYDSKRAGDSFRGRPVLETAPNVPAHDLARIVNVFRDKQNYGGRTPRCFYPGLGLSIRSIEKTVDALVCLDCLKIFLYDATFLYGASEDETDITLPIRPASCETILNCFRPLFPSLAKPA